MGGINTAKGRSVQVRVIWCKGALDASALSLQPKATGTRASRGLCELLLSRWDPHGCKKRQVAVAVCLQGAVSLPAPCTCGLGGGTKLGACPESHSTPWCLQGLVGASQAISQPRHVRNRIFCFALFLGVSIAGVSCVGSPSL